MNEFELIARLTKSLPTNKNVLVGAGDDCAVLDLGVPEKLILFKTDAVVEGIHFTKETPPEKIGRKALARCLSDIAAMAGTPVAALVTMALPKNFDAEFVGKIYDGLNALAEKSGVAIVGGETTTNPERILISIALIGTVPRGKQILRSGAKVGDAIFVTGELGGSLAGRHLEFEPRLAEARWLAEHFGWRSAAYLESERRWRGDFEVGGSHFARGEIVGEGKFGGETGGGRRADGRRRF